MGMVDFRWNWSNDKVNEGKFQVICKFLAVEREF